MGGGALRDDTKNGCEGEYTAPAFDIIFYWVFGLVRNQHEFPSCRIDFNSKTYFVRPKTRYCQQQSSQYPIFQTKYQKILDTADFARRENCSLIRLIDAFRKTLLKGSQKRTTHYESRVQSNTRADFKLTYRENYGKLWQTFCFEGRGGEYVNTQWETHQSLSTVASPVQIK